MTIRTGPQTPARATIEVSVEIANEGAHAAEETVFLFIRDPVASVARPTLELKGVAKIALGPGETGIARMRLPAKELEFLGSRFEPVLADAAAQPRRMDIHHFN